MQRTSLAVLLEFSVFTVTSVAFTWVFGETKPRSFPAFKGRLTSTVVARRVVLASSQMSSCSNDGFGCADNTHARSSTLRSSRTFPGQ